MDVPGTPLAFSEAVTSSLSAQFSSASSAVMIFVVEAMGKRSFSFWPKSTRPLFASMSTAPLAATLSPSEAQLPASRGRKSNKSNMQTILFTARPSPIHIQKAYARAVTLLPGFAAKFFHFAPRAGVDIGAAVR